MNLDAKKLEALTALDDTALWETVRSIAGTHGLSLPESTPSHEELERLRDACRGVGKISMLQAMRIVNDLKRRGGK